MKLAGKTVIFSTSDIFTTVHHEWDHKHVELKVDTIVPGSGYENERVRIWSYGALEMALSEGAKVLVSSTRTTLGDTDKWWLDLLKDHGQDGCVFLAENRGFHPDYSSGWKKLFAELSVEWPKDEFGQEEFWTQALQWLKKNHPEIVIGYELRQV
jgi:hypothetical protein